MSSYDIYIHILLNREKKEAERLHRSRRTIEMLADNPMPDNDDLSDEEMIANGDMIVVPIKVTKFK